MLEEPTVDECPYSAWNSKANTELLD